MSATIDGGHHPDKKESRLGAHRSVDLTEVKDRDTAVPTFGELTMALAIPWLLEREYQQHRNLDYYGLPETFEAWQEVASALADQLSRVTRRRVVKVMIHPGELEEWARRKGRAVSTEVRTDFARTLWQAENTYTADRDFRTRVGAD